MTASIEYRVAEFMSTSLVVNGRTVLQERTKLTPNEGCDIYTIVPERPVQLYRLHDFLFVTDGCAEEWEAGTILAEDGTGRAVTWRKSSLA